MVPNSARKARIVARINKGQSKKEPESGSLSKQPWISVQRSDQKSNSSLVGTVKISLATEKTASGKQSCYDVDECYEQDVRNEEMFSSEVKPLIPGLFGGQNVTVFAYGPRNSGKTYTIRGTEEELGLVSLTIDTVLPRAKEEGKVVTVSVFEVYQDRVIDLLDSIRPEVSVFEDAQGKIRLRGLSKVKVDSLCEFQKIYLPAANVHKTLQKAILEQPHRSHVGCIIHVVSPQTENSSAHLVGKINFVDLASFEDSRRKSSDSSGLAETTRINKSLFAVHNVLYALNANESRVPFRESKLTRMLQDSLGGMSRAIMVACMNRSFCAETVQTISIASRSCQAGFLASLDPGNSRSATKTKTIPSSPQVLKTSKIGTKTSMFSPKIMKPVSASASGRKQSGGSQLRTTMKKSNGAATEVKARKLFAKTNQLKKADQVNTSMESASVVESSAQSEVTLSQESEPTFKFSSLEEEMPESNHASSMDSSQVPLSEETPTLNTLLEDRDFSQLPLSQDVINVESIDVVATPSTYQTPNSENFPLEDKENKILLLNYEASPPLSARIRELSNNLKSLCVSTESKLKIAQDSAIRCQIINENFEPKTPVSQKCLKIEDKREIANTASPWENYRLRGSGMKDSLVKEYLKFINSASKEELKGLKGIGEKRASYILEMREESPEPFKELDDLKEIGLSEKQIKGMMKGVAEDLFA